MRRFASMLLVLALLGFARAAAAESEVPRPVAGKSLQLNQKQTKVQPTKDGPMTIVAEVPIFVKVLQADAQRTVVRWQRGKFKLTDVDCDLLRKEPDKKPLLMQAAMAQMGPIVSAMDHLTFDLIFSPKGDYLGLANYKDVLGAAVRSLDAMDELRVKNGNERMKPEVRGMILNRKTIEQSFPREALTYFAAGTYEVRRGTIAAFDGTMPNPMGGEQVASRVEVKFDQANDASGFAVIHTTSSINMDQFVNSIKQMIARSPEGKPMSAEDEKQLRAMQLEWKAEYHIDPASGLANWVQQKAGGTGAAAAQSEEFLWTVTPAKR